MYTEDIEELIRYASKPVTYRSVELSIDGAREMIGFTARNTKKALMNMAFYLESPIVDRASFTEEELDTDMIYDSKNKILTLADGRVTVRFGKTAKEMRSGIN